MKKWVVFLFIAALLFSIVPKHVEAASSIIIRIDGTVVKPKDAAPTISNDRVIVPLRFVSEHMGASVKWDDRTRTATITKGNITLYVKENVDSITKYKNGKKSLLTMDVPAKNVNGSLMVSIRSISEAFEKKVFWDKFTSTVHIDNNRTSSGFLVNRDGYSFDNDTSLITNDALCAGFAMSSVMNYIGKLTKKTKSYSLPSYNRLWDLKKNNTTEKMLVDWWKRANNDSIFESYMVIRKNTATFAKENHLDQSHMDTILRNIKKNYPVYLGVSHTDVFSDNDVGHAVVGYAYEERSSNEIWVYIYDNNYHGDFGRKIKFYKKSNGKWQYIWSDYASHKFANSENASWDIVLSFEIFDTSKYAK